MADEKTDRYIDGEGWRRYKPPAGQVVVVPIERRAKAFRFITPYDHVADSTRYALNATKGKP